LVEALGEKQKAETFARALERSIQAIDERADEAIALLALTLANPTFAALVGKIFP